MTQQAEAARVALPDGGGADPSLRAPEDLVGAEAKLGRWLGMTGSIWGPRVCTMGYGNVSSTLVATGQYDRIPETEQRFSTGTLTTSH